MTEKMKFIDLFAGIGGFRSALERNGHECIAFSEFDRFAVQSYKAIYDTDNEIELGDITKISDEELKELKKNVDIVVGGSPCFRKGTKITTKHGLKNIEDIKKGDMVLTHENRYKPVVMPMVTHAKSIYKLEVKECGVTYVTEEHPFLVIESDEILPHWVKTKDLDTNKHFIQLGETVNTTADIEFSPILSLEKETTDELVYNFEVKDDNSYVANNLVAHNCQSFSTAGLKRGFDDTRGTLFFDYARVIKDTQPKMFLYENVKGLLSHDKQETIKTMLSAFDELDYYIDFNVFNSKFYGVPQSRERMYVLGIRKDLINKPEYHEKIKGNRIVEQIHNWAVDNIEMVKLLPELKDEVTTQLYEFLDTHVDDKFYISDEKIKILLEKEDVKSKIINYHLDSINQIGNFLSHRTSFGGNGQRGRIYLNKGVSPTLLATANDTIPKIAITNEINVLGNTSTTKYRSQNVHSVYGLTPTLAARDCKGAKQVAIPVTSPEFINKTQRGRRFKNNNESMFTLTSFDRHGIVTTDYRKNTMSNDVKHFISYSDTLIAKDNYIYPSFYNVTDEELDDYYIYNEPLVKWVKKNLILVSNQDDTQHELIKVINSHIGESILVSDNVEEINKYLDKYYHDSLDNIIVRKLTPIEYFRLQGLTDEQFYKAKNSGVSDSQLYKQAGNAVTVNVVDYIISHATKHIE